MLGATGLSALAADLSCASCLEGVPNSVEAERFSVVFRHMVVQWSGTITQWDATVGQCRNVLSLGLWRIIALASAFRFHWLAAVDATSAKSMSDDSFD